MLRREHVVMFGLPQLVGDLPLVTQALRLVLFTSSGRRSEEADTAGAAAGLYLLSRDEVFEVLFLRRLGLGHSCCVVTTTAHVAGSCR